MWGRIQKIAFKNYFRRPNSVVLLTPHAGRHDSSDYNWFKYSSSWISSYLLVTVIVSSSHKSSCSSADTIYRLEDVANHKNFESGIWVYYEDGVYDITKYISNHPGGNRILLAAGKNNTRTRYYSQISHTKYCRRRSGTILESISPTF